ncbi:MAG: bifunctional YncE family protein/alkaline phosphatase family protein [Candidatus Neomarinimicrobiota bacterium]
MNHRKSFFTPTVIIVVSLIAGCVTTPVHVDTPRLSPRLLPGLTDDGKVLLPNQWSLKPSGKQMLIGDLPLNTVFSPDGRFLVITHGGYGPNEIVVVRVSENGGEDKIISRVELDNLWYGIAFSPDGKRLFATGGKDDIIYQFDFNEGYLNNRRDIDVFEERKTILPSGIAVASDGNTLYVANNRDHSVGIVDLALDTSTIQFLLLPDKSYPYSCVLSPAETTLYVSLWGKAQVAEIDLISRTIRRFIPTDDHPNEMCLDTGGERLFVSNANENTVSVIETATGKVVEKLNSALYPGAPEGSTPNSLALSEDGKHLVIANADNNNLAVFEMREDEPSRSIGFIPVGWYPTSVRFHPLTGKIYVANGKGQSSKANPLGPNPGIPNMTTTEYIARLFVGTLSIIDWPDADELREYTQTAYECSPYVGLDRITGTVDQDNPIPARLGDSSPIKYCVYIVKENRTYDQVFGDIREGNGDRSLCLFPEKVTPNHHAIAKEFVLLDNFYVESEVSADGHEWSMGAYATDFVEKSWPNHYGHNGRWSLGYPAEGAFEIARPTAGYIWDRCAGAGVTYRSYGEFINNGETPDEPGTAAVKSLEGHFDPYFRSYDLSYSEIDRANRFIAELKQFEEKGELPRFIVMRLPNDHTAGTRPDYPTPTAMVAENDLALGMVVEALGQSIFWPEMAVFVVEDDAQNGPDHVDAHRTVALVVSPYCKRGIVDSQFYSTASMLRTMELILGLEPMSQFDAAARPMYASFTMKRDLTAYTHRPPQVDIREKNPPQAWGGTESMAMNLEVEDAADDIQFNEIIWKSVRGVDSAMPPPVRAAFVFPHIEEDD